MKIKILILLFIFYSLAVAQIYQKVEINLNDKSFSDLITTGIIVDHFERLPGNRISVFLEKSIVNKLATQNYTYKVVINDWYKFVEKQKSVKKKSAETDLKIKNFNLNNFKFGSMAGFLTYSEVIEFIDSLHIKYPNLVSKKFSIGKTIKDRDQWVIKLSDNPEINEDEPQVLYTSLIHSREPQSMMTLVYFIDYLLSNYSTDSNIKYLINNRELYFILVVNTDGYEYNSKTHPEGYGMWRKNLRDNNDDGQFNEMMDGVDLNRNFGFNWGIDDIGSAPFPSSTVFRGTSAFSEPEALNVKKFCESKNFKFALNYHSYGNLLIIPWAYENIETPDSLFYREIATDMTRENNYLWGTAGNIIYNVNGDTDDWMYGEQLTKRKIFAMTPEVGQNSDSELGNGFWPDIDRIIPLAKVNLFSNIYVAWVAGEFPYIESIELNLPNNEVILNEPFDFSLKLANRGLENSENLSIHILGAGLDKNKIITLNNRTSNAEMVFDNLIISDTSLINKRIPLKIKLEKEEVVLDSENVWIEVRDNISSNNDKKVTFDYKLLQNYPNPFNPSTQISFSLKKGGFVNLEVFDISGRLIKVLVNKYLDAGWHNTEFDASQPSLSSGIYIYRLNTSIFSASQKMILIK